MLIAFDTHRVQRNGVPGRREDAHERAAHISLAALFSLRPARKPGCRSATHQEAPWVGTVETFHFHPQMHPRGLRNHPHTTKKTPTPGNRLWDEGADRSEAQAQ